MLAQRTNLNVTLVCKGRCHNIEMGTTPTLSPWGPRRETPESRDGHRYVIVFVDDHSGTLGIYSLKSSSDSVKATKQSLADTVPYRTVNRLRSDNSGEYTREELKSLLYIPN